MSWIGIIFLAWFVFFIIALSNPPSIGIPPKEWPTNSKRNKKKIIKASKKVMRDNSELLKRLDDENTRY